jgi:hypothetical protein
VIVEGAKQLDMEIDPAAAQRMVYSARVTAAKPR